ncbi:MAG: uracil-DNA glycosylase [Leptospiraceae bacterium]|nr:uracil-DNA glycosylase [Leptospiraceae bacterium]MDW7976161.1 uracil-DNA glycosylase [Leptospiraceae bacterium]
MDLFEYAEKTKQTKTSTPRYADALWKNSDFSFVNSLEELESIAKECRKCKLCVTRRNVVFGEGNPRAHLMFIGEGPGKTEDETGRPFVGRAGELLTRMIENGLKIPREKVYIANVVKCRPTVDMKGEKDRPPDAEEVAYCSPYLIRQIELIQPKIIIALGNPASKFLLNTTAGITKIRGQLFYYKNIPVIPTYHPSYVLRNGGDDSPLKRDVWEDLKKVLNLMKERNITPY